MKIASFKQTTLETKRYEVDYSAWLDTSETISTVTITATPAGLTLTNKSVSIDSTGIFFYAAAGTSDTEYRLDLLVTTNQGQTKEDHCLITVFTED